MHLFTSVVLDPGHPDKCADIIADTLVDAYQENSNSRVTSEVFFASTAFRLVWWLYRSQYSL